MRTSGTIDFTSRWDGRTTVSLARVPRGSKGICGCQLICLGSQEPIFGIAYIRHQAAILERNRTPPPSPKRQRLLSPSRPSTVPGDETHHYSPASPLVVQSAALSPQLDPEEAASLNDSGAVPDGNELLSDAQAAADGHAGEEESPGLGGADEPANEAASGSGGELGRGSSDEAGSEEGARAPVEELQGDEEESCEPIDLEALYRSLPRLQPDLVPLSADDHIVDWVQPLTFRSFLHDHSGNAPNPYADTPAAPSSPARKFLEAVPVLLALSLNAGFNVCRSAVELVLKQAAVVQIAREDEYAKYARWYKENHPAASADLLASLATLDPARDPIQTPISLATALKRLDIDQTVIVHPVCAIPTCCHVHEDIRTIAAFDQLPKHCPGCEMLIRDDYGVPQVLPFPIRELWRELERVLKIPGVWAMLKGREERKRARERQAESRKGDHRFHQGKIYREQDDGSAWGEREVGNELHHQLATFIIDLLFSLDWANASSNIGAASNSFGPILCELAGTGNRLRSYLATVMILGTTPGPKKPSATVLYKLLVPLFKQLRDAETNGVWLQTPEFPKGGLFLVRLSCIIADRPAAVDITGGPHYKNKDSACLRCEVSHEDTAAMTVRPHRDSCAHSRAVLREKDLIAAAIAKEEEESQAETRRENLLRSSRRQLKVKPLTQKRRDEIAADLRSAKGNISATMLLHRFDKFRSTPFDVMHSLPEGLVKTSFFQIGISGEKVEGPAAERKLLGDGALKKFQDSFGKLILPRRVTRLHSLFGNPGAHQPSADQWRCLATIYGPLLLPQILHARLIRFPSLKPQFDLMMRLFEIVTLALRSSISEAQIAHLEILIHSYQRDMYRFCPALYETTNFHVLLHLPEDLRRYGPCYGWWSFRLERVNFILKQINVGGSALWQDVVVRMRAYLRKWAVEEAPKELLGPAEGNGTLQDRIRGAFGAVTHGLTVGMAFTGIVKPAPGQSDQPFPFESKKAPISRPMSGLQYQLLRECLASDGVTFTTIDTLSVGTGAPYLAYASSHFSHITINGVRIEPGRSRVGAAIRVILHRGCRSHPQSSCSH